MKRIGFLKKYESAYNYFKYADMESQEMIYADKTIKLLDDIIGGEYKIEDNESDIKEAFDRELNAADVVVLCGALPYSASFAREMSKTKKVYYLDAGDGEGMYAGCPIVSVTDLECLGRKWNVLYVIMSRSMVEFYMYVIRKSNPLAKVMFYASALIAHSEWFDLPARDDYTSQGIVKSIQYIHDNAAEIKKLLVMLNDVHSREIYSRIILFRLIFDMNLNEGVKTSKTEYLDDDIISWKQKEHIVDVGRLSENRQSCPKLNWL